MIAGPFGPLLLALGLRVGFQVATRVVDGVASALGRSGSSSSSTSTSPPRPGGASFAAALDAAGGARAASLPGAGEGKTSRPEAVTTAEATAVRDLVQEDRARALALGLDGERLDAARRQDTGRMIGAYRRFDAVSA